MRQLAYISAALVAVAVLAAALAGRTATSERPSPLPADSAAPPAPEVRGSLPADRVVRARVGDVVHVDVSTTLPDEAAILDLGLRAPTAIGAPGVLYFVADIPGRFPVELTMSNRRAGTIAVEAAAR
jgi:FtsP/CotA-like multicopper oxidase with cupredoxin domain